MLTTTLFLGTIPILVAATGFQDAVVARAPINHLVGRAPQADDLGAEICSDITALFSICNSATPGIFSSATTDIAGCLCYSSTVWAPTIFDSAVSSCAVYASTALPASDYSIASAFEGFCTSVGDYQKNANPGSSPTSNVPTTASPTPGGTLSPSPTPAATTPTAKPSASGSVGSSVDILTNSACSYVDFALSFCNSATPGFSTMDVSKQAPCLCYSSTKWSPNGFDGPVKTCADYVLTADPSIYSDFTSVEGFCSSIGDVTLAGASGKPTGASATGGIGIGIGAGGLTVPGGAKSTTASTQAANANTSPKTTSTPRSTGPAASAVTTSKSGDAPTKGLPMYLAYGLFLVAVPVAVVL